MNTDFYIPTIPGNKIFKHSGSCLTNVQFVSKKSDCDRGLMSICKRVPDQAFIGINTSQYLKMGQDCPNEACCFEGAQLQI